MHRARLTGLLLVSIATLAQQQQSVEITSEPSHHLVMENAYVRVFDVTVAPKASTLVHRHNKDYLFVTLGDSDVISARPGEKPAALLLKDGEIRYTPGKFAHAAINQSDKPFRNITIELLKPATNVKTCVKCASAEWKISSDQWTMSVFAIPQAETVRLENQGAGTLLVAISDLEISHLWKLRTWRPRYFKPGNLAWPPAGANPVIKNNSSNPAMYAVLEFNPEKQ